MISALDCGDRSDSRPGRFNPVKNTPGTHWIGGWVGPRTGLDAVEKRKAFPCLESKLGCSARSPSLYQLSCPGS
jgi:hypothetical protein